MPSPAAPDLAPIFTRDKSFTPGKPARKGNALFLLSIAAMFLLVVVGLWRASHDASAKNKNTFVMMAATEIPAGTTLRYTMLRSVPMSKHSVASAMISSADKLVGKVTRTFIPKGEPILTSDIFPGDQGLAVTLGQNERAITLALSDDALLDHAINPGDHVDVLAVTSSQGKKYTKTIGQDIRVLLCMPKGETTAHHTADMNKITLAVTPSLTEVLAEAAEVGKIRLVLRNRATIDQPVLAGVDPGSILPPGGPADQNQTSPTQKKETPSLPLPPPPVAQLAPPPAQTTAPDAPKPLDWIVEVISGDKKEQYGVPKH